MSVEIKFSFTNVAEAAAFMAQFHASKDAAPLPPIVPPAPEIEKAAPPPKPKAEKAASALKPPAEESPAPSPPTAATAPTAAPASAEPVTYEKSGIAAKIATAVGGGKRTEVVALLAEFGVAKGPLLKPEQFADFIEKIDAL